eukprot:JP448814.1.p2 GENE.JP448814.1~~JP448814.1.p2  ORF type:complete len:60 (+),score=23.91 JP448814.1:46-225(+)
MHIQGLFTWGNDEDNHQLGFSPEWTRMPTQSTSASGADQAEARYYGTSRHNGDFSAKLL